MVWVAASDRLGMDLSHAETKQFVRTVIQSYLLSHPTDEEPSEEERIICQLSKNSNVVLEDSDEERSVSIREFYYKDERQLPSAEIDLSTDEWTNFKKSHPAIDEAIRRMERRREEEIMRFDGRNYQVWAEHIKLLFIKLNIQYVIIYFCQLFSLLLNNLSYSVA